MNILNNCTDIKKDTIIKALIPLLDQSESTVLKYRDVYNHLNNTFKCKIDYDKEQKEKIKKIINKIVDKKENPIKWMKYKAKYLNQEEDENSESDIEEMQTNKNIKMKQLSEECKQTKLIDIKKKLKEFNIKNINDKSVNQYRKDELCKAINKLATKEKEEEPQEKEEPEFDIKNCNTRKYTKIQLLDYIKQQNLPKPTSKDTKTKEDICNFIKQKQISKPQEKEEEEEPKKELLDNCEKSRLLSIKKIQELSLLKGWNKFLDYPKKNSTKTQWCNWFKNKIKEQQEKEAEIERKYEEEEIERKYEEEEEMKPKYEEKKEEDCEKSRKLTIKKIQEYAKVNNLTKRLDYPSLKSTKSDWCKWYNRVLLRKKISQNCFEKGEYDDEDSLYQDVKCPDEDICDIDNKVCRGSDELPLSTLNKLKIPLEGDRYISVLGSDKNLKNFQDKLSRFKKPLEIQKNKPIFNKCTVKYHGLSETEYDLSTLKESDIKFIESATCSFKISGIEKPSIGGKVRFVQLPISGEWIINNINELDTDEYMIYVKRQLLSIDDVKELKRNIEIIEEPIKQLQRLDIDIVPSTEKIDFLDLELQPQILKDLEEFIPEEELTPEKIEEDEEPSEISKLVKRLKDIQIKPDNIPAKLSTTYSNVDSAISFCTGISP